MKMKKMFAAVFGLILALSMSMTAFAGTWRMDGGMWWYENDDGSYPANGFYFIRGEEYYFDVNGYMASSRWLHLTGDRWCYATGSGALAKNQWIGDYYFDDEGIMMTSTWTPDGYYVDADGKYNPSMGRQGASSGGDIPIGYYNSVGYNGDYTNYRVDGWVSYGNGTKVINFGHYEPTGSPYSFYDKNNPNGDTLELYYDNGKIYGKSTKSGHKSYLVEVEGDGLLIIHWENVTWNGGDPIVLEYRDSSYGNGNAAG